MWPIDNIEEHDLSTPEGLTWWVSLTEAQREEWRSRVRSDPVRTKDGKLVIGGLSNFSSHAKRYE